MTAVVNLRDEDYEVFIGRPSLWSNPFKIGLHGSREDVIEKFRQYVLDHPFLLEEARKQLKGRVLGCYCKPLPCHGDVWCELLDQGEE